MVYENDSDTPLFPVQMKREEGKHIQSCKVLITIAVLTKIALGVLAQCQSLSLIYLIGQSPISC